MKKLAAIILGITMTMACSLTAFAVPGGSADQQTAKFTVYYKSVNNGSKPEETFTFSEFTKVGVTDAGVGANGAVVTMDTMPNIPQIENVTIQGGNGNSEGQAVINLPEFPAVGVYTYSFSQNIGKTAGVEYYKEDNKQDMKLVVTVVENGGKKRVAAVHVENKDTQDDKTNEITNLYKSGSLAVTKNVTGNLGDKSKYFSVDVTFTPKQGETINSIITYSGGSKSPQVQNVNGNKVTIELKDGETVNFSNIPEGTTWTVTEKDYTSEKYESAKYSKQTDTIAAGDADTSVITNHKEMAIDTGIGLDSLPYILIVAGVLLVGFTLFFLKRRNKDI